MSKGGNFVRSGHCLVQFLCFGAYFSPSFSRIGYNLKTKVLEPGKTTFVPAGMAQPVVLGGGGQEPPKNSLSSPVGT